MRADKSHFLLLTTAVTAWLAVANVAFAGPAPVQNYGANAPSRNGSVVAQKGDTFQTLARLYKVDAGDLAAANGSSPNDKPWIGQRLVLPMPRTHKVMANDTMFSLSRMYGTTVEAMAVANGISAPYALKAGQVLRIPSSARAASPSQPAALSKPAEVAPTAPTTSSIVWKSDAPKMLKNPGPSPVTKAFDALIGKIAGGHSADDPKTESVEKISFVSAATAEPVTATAQTVGRSRRAGFIWPVRGQVISSYGPKTGGLYNDGINIAAPRGTPVQAASDGVVAYVGDKLKSYGNLVLIRHSNGMITTYAHLSTVAVKQGARVSQGQVIGSVGSTGTVMNAQLHFEVRRGKNTLDPKEYLG